MQISTEKKESQDGMPLFVSVIIPVYNDPDRIGKCLGALINQTYPHNSYEIIVADNGSMNETSGVIQDYCDKHPDLIRMVVESEIQSSYAARNKSVEKARGEILAFTDSDCIPNRDWIKSGAVALDKQDATCGGGHIEFLFKGEQPNIYEHFDAGRKLNQKAFVEKSGFAATANFFVRREMLDRYGLFRHDLISGGDYEFGRRLTDAGEKMIYIADAVVKHPARATLRAILKKSRRVAEGQKQLENLGLYDHRKVSWRQLLPVKSSVAAPCWNGRVSLFDKVRIMMLHNFVRWLNFYTRLR